MTECIPTHHGNKSNATHTPNPAGGFTARALRVSGSSRVRLESHAPGNREDFLQAVAILDSSPKPGCAAASGTAVRGTSTDLCAHRQFRPVLVSMPWTTWVRVFGDPQQITRHLNRLVRMPVHVWQQQCTDGSMICIGHLFEHAPGKRWVTLTRVGMAP